MRSLSRLMWIGLGALALAGCERESQPVLCVLPEFRYGLNVIVVDSVTGAPPASATLIARSGTYVDSVGPEAAFVTESYLMLSSAPERPGVYDVTVRSPGYLAWTRTGVQVTADECHVNPVQLNARLRK